MAWIQSVPSGYYHISFRFGGRKFKRALRTKNNKEAKIRLARLEDNMRLVESGRLDVPDNADNPRFLLSDGKVTTKDPTGQSIESPLTIQDLFTQFFAGIPEGNLESSTMYGMRIHERHLIRLLKPGFPIQTLTLQHLQDYVNVRSGEMTHNGTTVTAATILKELVTLGTVWRWAESVSKIIGTFPRRGVRLPKTTVLPLFQSWEEIERKIKQDKLKDSEAESLWDALYLRRTEIDELLAHAKEAAAHPFIHPMFVMAAHTGARRSELLRSRRSDFDFATGFVTTRERKRVRGRATTRRVPLSTALRAVMQQWIEEDLLGGPFTFCLSGQIARSRSPVSQEGLSPHQAHDHFGRTLQNGRWEKIKGWHCLRHSFISNLASAGTHKSGNDTACTTRQYNVSVLQSHYWRGG